MGDATAVRTAVRIRPLCEKEIKEGSRTAAHAISESATIELGASGSGDPRRMVFDQVYGDSSTSSAVYEGSVAPLLLRALEGYNVTIFAYGQTGEGSPIWRGVGRWTPHYFGYHPRS